MKIAGYILTTVLVLFGVLFLMSARGEYTQNPGGRIVTGLVLIGIGLAIVVFIKMNEPKPDKKIEITQKIDLSGSVKAEEMKCKQCGAPLDKNAVVVKEGAVFINCPFCSSAYQITEEPKW